MLLWTNSKFKIQYDGDIGGSSTFGALLKRELEREFKFQFTFHYDFGRKIFTRLVSFDLFDCILVLMFGFFRIDVWKCNFGLSFL